MEPYDTGWIDLSALLVSPAVPASSTLWVRRVDTVVAVVGNLSGSFTTDGTVTNLTGAGAVPADSRPGTSESVFGVAYGAGGYPATVLVRSNGSMAFFMRDAPSARSSLQFSGIYHAA